MKDNIIIAVIAITAVMLGLWALGAGLERQERYECKKWQAEASKLHGYYLTEWQEAQCSQYETK